ncbi:DUF421 domain-containing protein [Sedimentibacter sp. zth1]|uniref:DUF421 domain-containing protein n=1 Tax=Sedimentibacter sp. zth1 TaxID=2816908 RepID=UPI001A934DE0|nr:DUF421 domain-containing protein [Sedimentibacter sp. zth1]QSX07049.1 DUF421 domain-containing protein [Sedimentibacter sp. zth1]
MIIVLLRAVVLYVVVLFSLRIMGKGQLGELEPFDFVISLMIAELAAMPIEDLNSPISHGITAIVTLMFLQCFTSFISLKSSKARRFLSGNPSILVSHGKFNLKKMRDLRVNVNDILGQIRLKGFTNIEDIDYLIMETNGQISVIANQDIKSNKCKRLPISIVVDGKISNDNMEKFRLSNKKLNNALEKNKLELKDVIYGYVDEDENYILIKKNLGEII